MNHVKPESLSHHRILVLGYGVNNEGLVDYLLRQGCSFVIRDANPAAQERFAGSHPHVQQVTWEITADILKDLHNFDLIFRSPSIPAFAKELVKARKAGALVTSQTDLFMQLSPAPIVGVTGTKGKGTTSSLLTQILQTGYKKGKTYVGGNIGVDPFTFIEVLKPQDIVILELSSFQLEDLERSPHIAVVLHVTADHLDHHISRDAYKEAKARILHYQKKDDIAVINGEYPDMEYFAKQAKGTVYRYTRHTPARQAGWVDTQDNKEVVFYQLGETLDSFELPHRKLLGEHNLENIIPAVIVGAHFGVPAAVMAEVVQNFSGLEHRLMAVENDAGILAFDDSIATTPESCQVALEAMPQGRIHLVAGGKDTGKNYTQLAEEIARRCLTVTFLPGNAAEELERALKMTLKKHKQYMCTLLHAKGETPLACMEQALAHVVPHLQVGDIVLLAPSAKSTTPFLNYKERGNAFVTAVQKLKKEA